MREEGRENIHIHVSHVTLTFQTLPLLVEQSDVFHRVSRHHKIIGEEHVPNNGVHVNKNNS